MSKDPIFLSARTYPCDSSMAGRQSSVRQHAQLGGSRSGSVVRRDRLLKLGRDGYLESTKPIGDVRCLGDYGASSGALDALQLAWKEWLEYKVGAIIGSDSN